MRLLIGSSLLALCCWITKASASSSSVTSQEVVAMEVTTVKHSNEYNIQLNETAFNVIMERARRIKEFRENQRNGLDARSKQQRQRKMRELLLKTSPAPDTLQRISPEEYERLRQQQPDKNNHRQLKWWSNSDAAWPYSADVLADPSQYYDKWAQGYRMLGAMIDCDHSKRQQNHRDEKNGNNNNNDNNGGQTGCSRWMLWAAYVNPNYQGYEYDEYYGDNPVSDLDCHSPDTDWELLGVYRQEFYQFIEQISKHLWAIDEYEYVTALAGLSYMTKYECFTVGYDDNGNEIKASIAPQRYGKFEMALYTDDYCLVPNTSLGKTYDDYGYQSNVYLGSKDKSDDDGKSWASDWWSNAQEYTLTNVNDVYEEFKYCTSCVDYPTYQDGYFIGNYGTDDDDLINQCWKFHSHDSFTCEAECIAMANAQGTILSLKFGDTIFGKSYDGFSSSRNEHGAVSHQEKAYVKLAANVFLTAAFLLFVATFLAFAVARRSRYRESRSGRSRRLLDEDEGRSRRSRHSKSREGDGLFKTSRSKSSDRRRSRSSSRKKRSSSVKSKSTYDPPKEPSSRSRTGGVDEFF